MAELMLARSKRVSRVKEVRPAGAFVLVDDEDLPMLSQYKWIQNANGYVVAAINGKVTYMSKLLMRPEPGQVVTHVEGNKLDCRKSRLYVETRSKASADALDRYWQGPGKWRRNQKKLAKEERKRQA
jgi:hypothetical protein